MNLGLKPRNGISSQKNKPHTLMRYQAQKEKQELKELQRLVGKIAKKIHKSY